MSENLYLQKLTTVAEMLPNYALVRQLSPQLTSLQYAAMLLEMVPHNYFQVAAYLGEQCVAISGYWLSTKLYCGKYLEIDNFIVDQAQRNNGIGKLLLDWMQEEALLNGCSTIMLDAYVENFKAHRFYYREGFVARGYHFLKQL